MHTVHLKLVTIVTEPVLEHRLVPELRALGATGHTVTDSRGEGSRGMRAGEIPGEGRRIEVVVSEAVAERIMTHLAEHYFPRYAVIAYVGDVAVLRGEKYVR